MPVIYVCIRGHWAAVTSNGSPYATGPLSCLSVTLVYCGGQTVRWIKMPLGTEVGAPRPHCVRRGTQLPPTERGTAAPTFRPTSIVAKRSSITATAELLFYSRYYPTRQRHTHTHTQPTDYITRPLKKRSAAICQRIVIVRADR